MKLIKLIKRRFLRNILTLENQFIQLRNRHFLAVDIFIFLTTPLIALELLLSGVFIWEKHAFDLFQITLLFLVLKLAILYISSFYKRCWRYASVDELQQIAGLTLTIGILQTGLFQLLNLIPSVDLAELPASLPLLDSILSFILIGGLRFSIRMIERLSHRCSRSWNRRERVLIVGAGSAGVMLVREMQRAPRLGFRPVGFIDDDPAKLNLWICQLPVLGNRHSIPQWVCSLRIHKIIIAMPSSPEQTLREIMTICNTTGILTSTLPGLEQILNGQIRLSDIRDIRVEELLKRAPIQMDIQPVVQLIQNKRVLITGAGGSIGSELCRQILNCCPAEIALVGHGENSVFLIQQELEKTLKTLQPDHPLYANPPHLLAVIADIRFKHRLNHIFEQFRPEIIFHAAAHKHVPMMESNAPEAITNNVMGTRNLLDLALQFEVETFVMVSTDKAVNPTNVMGASKRVAEMLVLQAAQTSQKRFVVVRFGNVLGSRGSVIPTFKQQIAAGGPVTVTHPEINRYFMTIPEAVQLVLQAAVLRQGSEVLMLNMGQPVKIVDLAKELIRLSGYEVGKDIDIIFTGLRPGEKLYEELLICGEQYEPTAHEKLFIVKNASGFVPQHLEPIVEALCQAAIDNNQTLILFLLEQLIPSYRPQHPASLVQSGDAREEAGQRQSGIKVANMPLTKVHHTTAHPLNS